MKIKIIKLSFILLIIFAGCSKNLLDENTPSLLTANQVFKNLAGFESALNGLYSSWRAVRDADYAEGIGTNGEGGFVGTDLIQGPGSNASNFTIVTESFGAALNPSVPYLWGTFNWLYQIVNASNTIINRAQNPSVDWTGNGLAADDNKNRVIGEAKAIRAWAYRFLTYAWGDVPLNLNESNGSNIRSDWERTPVGQVRAQMRSDLLFAEKYVTTEPSKQGRISKGAIQTFLAELYLTLNKPDSALIYANIVVNEPAYKLITARYGVKKSLTGVPFMDMFYDGNSNREEGNTEALWVMQNAKWLTGGTTCNIMRRNIQSRYDVFKIGGVTPLKITLDRGGRARSRWGITKFLVDLYGPTDDRGSNYAIRKYFILSNAATNNAGITGGDLPGADNLPPGMNYGDTIWCRWSANWINPDNSLVRYRFPYSRKYDYADPMEVQVSCQYNCQVYLRAADAYLLKAEAQFKLGDSPGAAATINIIRARAHATPIIAAQVNIDFILDERARELVYEEDRRFTLLRTHKFVESTQLYNPNGGQFVTQRDTIFPIPQSVINANLTKPMAQNPGY